MTMAENIWFPPQGSRRVQGQCGRQDLKHAGAGADGATFSYQTGRQTLVQAGVSDPIKPGNDVLTDMRPEKVTLDAERPEAANAESGRISAFT
jgi:hypothetical protein